MEQWIHTLQAISPTSPGETWAVGIPQSKFRLLQDKGHTVKLFRLRLVEEILTEDAIAIIKGWSRPGKENCWVYVGKANRDLRGPNIEVPPPSGMLFVVFVLPDGSIDDWGWRLPSENNPDIPQGVAGDVIWPQPN